jgi:hypothetical protein
MARPVRWLFVGFGHERVQFVLAEQRYAGAAFYGEALDGPRPEHGREVAAEERAGGLEAPRKAQSLDRRLEAWAEPTLRERLVDRWCHDRHGPTPLETAWNEEYFRSIVAV